MEINFLQTQTRMERSPPLFFNVGDDHFINNPMWKNIKNLPALGCVCLLRVLDDFKINEAQKLIREAETQEIPSEKNKVYRFFTRGRSNGRNWVPVGKDLVFKTWFNHVSGLLAPWAPWPTLIPEPRYSPPLPSATGDRTHYICQDVGVQGATRPCTTRSINRQGYSSLPHTEICLLLQGDCSFLSLLIKT